MPFSDPVVGGTKLIRPAIQSPNYVATTTGWTINQDGSAEFNNITVRGTVVLGTGTTNVIILDNSRNALFVYDALGHLVFSIAPSSGTDSLGNNYNSGASSYFTNNINQYTQMDSGVLRLKNGFSGNTAATAQGMAGAGPASNQPGLQLDSGRNASQSLVLDLIGSDVGATAAPFALMYGNSVHGDINFDVAGIINYCDPNTLVRETWHFVNATGGSAPAFNTNWANTGAPFGNVAFKRTNGGKVALTGMCQWNAAATPAPTTLFQLPAGYRPNRTVRVVAMSNPATATNPTTENLEIDSAGNVSLTNFSSGPNTPVSLEYIEFYLTV